MVGNKQARSWRTLLRPKHVLTWYINKSCSISQHSKTVGVVSKFLVSPSNGVESDENNSLAANTAAFRFATTIIFDGSLAGDFARDGRAGVS